MLKSVIYASFMWENIRVLWEKNWASLGKAKSWTLEGVQEFKSEFMSEEDWSKYWSVFKCFGVKVRLGELTKRLVALSQI